jgi:hypothetical protein
VRDALHQRTRLSCLGRPVRDPVSFKTPCIFACSGARQSFQVFFFTQPGGFSLDTTGQGTSTVLAVSTDGIVACRRYSTTVSAYRVVQGQPRWPPISSVFRSKALIGVP